jgi:hypothetical protein
MFQFLFIILLLVLFVALAFGFSVLQLLFGGLANFFKWLGSGNKQNRPQPNSGKSTTSSSASSKKIIPSDEGEYVDYVEIKE